MVRYDLLYPIPTLATDGTEAAHVTVRRPRLADLKAAREAKNTGEALAARCVTVMETGKGLTPSEWDRMDVADFGAIDEILERFMTERRPAASRSQGTGETAN